MVPPQESSRDKTFRSEGNLVADFIGVRGGTNILTPCPLSRYGEGEAAPCFPFPNTPSPNLGKGLGDGVSFASNIYACPIESLAPGDLVITHNNRSRPVAEVLSCNYKGKMLEIFCTGMEGPLCSTPSQPVARVLPDLPGTKANIETVRYLRTNTTPAERHLWKLIRGKNVGVKFRRQHPLGQFVLDFYAPQIRLAIELDGSIHNEALQKEYDRFRQKLIEQYEICFLRFGNELVLNMPSVPRDIIATIALRNKKYYYGICWTPAENIEVGDAVFAFGRNERRTVCAKRCFAADEKVYNLRVAEDNSYVTETCTVHNCVSER